MFQGTIPESVRQMLFDAAKSWKTKTLAVACSGNLTIERVFAGRYTLHGCDVSIYSCALGTYFARQPFRLAMKPEHREGWGWAEAGLADPAGRVATLMLLSNLTQAADKTLTIKDNPYWRRLAGAYRAQWPRLLDETRARLEANTVRLESFHCGDAVDWLASVPADAAVASFPPFFAGGYEAMWALLDRLFDWDAPAYADLFDDRRKLFLERLTGRDHWAFGTSSPLEHYAGNLRGITQTTARGVPLYIYSSEAQTRVVGPHQILAPVKAPRLSPGETLDGAIGLKLLSAHEFAALRAQYLNPRIKVASAGAAFGVTVGEKLIGVFAFSTSYGVPGATGDAIYLLSDFAVAPTDYARLSKLVLHAALSREAQVLAERLSRRRVRWIVTTAFSDKPVSMKYRGLFDLTSRKAGKDGEAAYRLNYQSAAGRWTLSEGFEEWSRKHATHTSKNE